MASSRDVVFPASMENFLDIPVNIRFGSMLTKFTALVVGLVVIENTAANSVQQIESDLLTETHPLLPIWSQGLIVSQACLSNPSRSAKETSALALLSHSRPSYPTAFVA
jgi:hypothetical protein